MDQNIAVQIQKANNDLDKQKIKELEKRKLQQESEALSNELRTAFGYSPWLNQKAINYKVSKMNIKPLSQSIDDHVIKKDNQFQPLQRLLQEERERVMVVEKGIDTQETIRFFIEKIREYNSIIDLEHIKKNKQHQYSELSYNSQTSDQGKKDDVMKRYTGDNGNVTNFHFVLNWQNLAPVFRELTGEKAIKNTKRRRKIQLKKDDQKVKKEVTIQRSQFAKSMEMKFNEIDQKSMQLSEQLDDGQNHEDFKVIAEQPQSLSSDMKSNQSILEFHKQAIEKIREKSSRKTSRNTSRMTKKRMTNLTSEKIDKKNEKGRKQRALSMKPTPWTSKQSSQVVFQDSNKKDLIRKMINENFDKTQMVQYLTNKEALFKNKLQSNILSRMISNDEKLDQQSQALLQSEINSYLLEISPELNKAIVPELKRKEARLSSQNPQQVYEWIQQGQKQLQPISPQLLSQQQPYPIVGIQDIEAAGIKRKLKLSSSIENQVNSVNDSQLSTVRANSEEKSPSFYPKISVKTPNTNAIDSYYNDESGRSRRRQNVIDEMISHKQPKYIHPGGTKFAVLNTRENIKLYKTKKSRLEEQLLEEIEKYKQRPIRVQEHMMTNLFVLSGPPKKVEYKTTDLRHDYNDMKVSKMMKQVLSSYK